MEKKLPAYFVIKRDSDNCLYCKSTEKIAKFFCTYDNKINDVDVTDVKRNKLKTIPQECPVRKATMMTNQSFNFIQLLNF